MNVTVLLKGLSAIALLGLAVLKLPDLIKSNESNSGAIQTKNDLSGVLMDVKQDSQFSYLHLVCGNSKKWVAVPFRVEVPKIGSTIEFTIDSKTKAYESIELTLAFEEMYFSRVLNVRDQKTNAVEPREA